MPFREQIQGRDILDRKLRSERPLPADGSPQRQRSEREHG
jgi:hypothetical protein